MSVDTFDEAVRAAADERCSRRTAAHLAFIEGAQWAHGYLSQPENDPRQTNLFDLLEGDS